jgi:hypothetical protein
MLSVFAVRLQWPHSASGYSGNSRSINMKLTAGQIGMINVTNGIIRIANKGKVFCFGSVRYSERRASGRWGAIAALVVRGPVRVLTALALRRQCFLPRAWLSLIQTRGTTCVNSSSSSAMRVANSCASARIPLPTLRRWRRSFSRQPCHPRFFCTCPFSKSYWISLFSFL